MYKEVELKDEFGTAKVYFTDQPIVGLVRYTPQPLELIGHGMSGYLGNYSQDDPLNATRLSIEATKTKLAAPVEWVDFVFVLRDVPRTFTHQLVRYRIGMSFVQESTRVSLDRYSFFVARNLKKEPYISEYIDFILHSLKVIRKLQHSGKIHHDDLRLLLPHGFATCIYWKTNLRALAYVFETRWCCQAEPTVWLPVLSKIRNILKSIDEDLLKFIRSPFERGESCGFHSIIDRPCRWQNKTAKELERMWEDGVFDETVEE